MWHWFRLDEVAAFAGFSTVPKKDPAKQRKLLMQCPANYLMIDPATRASYGLHGGLALSRAQVASGTWKFAVFDQDNALTRILVPFWMVKYVCAPPIQAIHVWGILPESIKDTIGPNDFVAPGCMRLAMGGTHSVHILMSISFYACGKILVRSAVEAPKAAVSMGLHSHGNQQDLSSIDNGNQQDLEDELWDARQLHRKSCSHAAGMSVTEFAHLVHQPR